MAQADSAAPWTYNFTVENDSFINGVDRHYTSGLYWSTTSPASEDDPFAPYADMVMLQPDTEQPTYRHGYFLGQSMFTPEDISFVHPDTTDRPYAGWLYAGLRTYRASDDILDRAEVTLGVAGSLSGAENVQKWWHAMNIFGGIHPDGWGSKLGNEPGLVLTEQRTWKKEYSLGGFQLQALPEVAASVGNIFTYAAGGGMLRFGQSLDADWGPPRILPALDGADFVTDQGNTGLFSWYAFVGFEERMIARNIFLDGNTFGDSASVIKKPFVSDFNGGFAFLFSGFHVYASYTQRTHEFKTQRGNDEFLSINLSWT